MAVSAREAAIAALHVTIATALGSRSPAPQVLRSDTVPQRIAAGGLVMIQDGETIEETAILSPLRWQAELLRQGFVPMFLLVPQVQLAKRLDVRGAGHRALARLPAAIAREWEVVTG